MTTATEIKHIVRDPDFYEGKPCIDNHKISVHDIAIRHNQRYSPEQIVSELFPDLSLVQVYAALLYYYEHKEEIDREIAEEAAEHAARASADMSPLAQKIRRGIAERKRQLGV